VNGSLEVNPSGVLAGGDDFGIVFAGCGLRREPTFYCLSSTIGNDSRRYWQAEPAPHHGRFRLIAAENFACYALAMQKVWTLKNVYDGVQAIVALISGTVLIAGCSSPATQKSFNLADAIPTGETAVEVLGVRYSDRVEELAQRMSSTVSTNQTWWIEYIKQHADDRPLPYHANFGLMKQEYAEWLDGMETTRHLQKASDAYVVFGRKGDFATVDVGDTNSSVGKWQLNTVTHEVILPTGEVIKAKWHSGDDATQPIGAYEGYGWICEPSNNTTSNYCTASLEIFRLKPSGMIFWRVNEGEIQNYRCVRTLDAAFRYKPKAARD
jgi:outer membrane murein-binding lipoprotein Lpp